jgi:hypothetical protein
MGLYITISLLAVLAAKPHGIATPAVLTLIWGTTLGLILAHWLAFQLTARLFTGSTLPRTTGSPCSHKQPPHSASPAWPPSPCCCTPAPDPPCPTGS